MPTPIDTIEAVQDGLLAISNLKARKQHAVRGAIWEVATNLFAEKSFDETTVDDIAQAAGISPRSFFRYFASKGDLMAYALVSFGDQLIAAIEACPDSYQLNEVFREAVLNVVREAVTQPRTRKVFEILRVSPAAAASEMSRLLEVQGLIARAFGRRLSGGIDEDLTAGVLAGLTLQLAGMSVRWSFEHGKADVPATVDRLLGAMETAFCRKRRPFATGGRERSTPQERPR